MNHLKLTSDKLSVEEVTDLVASPTCGAISVFMGTTRDNFEGKSVVTLEYEAYESMALKVLEKTCQQIREKWPSVENIGIYHRLGLVAVKESSIIIAIGSPHRQEATAATQWCIDHVKKAVPIWKKEVYSEDNSTKTHHENGKFTLEIEPEFELPFVDPYLIQIKASTEEMDRRIEKFMNRKREIANLNNVRNFCVCDRKDETTCARIDAIAVKKKDSNSHLEVHRVLNNYSKSGNANAIFAKHQPTNGVEERLKNIETHLSLKKTVPITIYQRLKDVEDRLLYMESISPEYINFWDKCMVDNKKNIKNKRTFTVQDIDSLISELQRDGDVI